jgi:hypothetical protein
MAIFKLYVKDEYYGELNIEPEDIFQRGQTWRPLLSEHFYCSNCGVVWLDYMREGTGHSYKPDTCPDCQLGIGGFRGGWFWSVMFYSYQLPYRALEEEFLRLMKEKD